MASVEPIVAETFMIPAADPDTQLCVRNKRLPPDDDATVGGAVLFVHGATYPSVSAFDGDLPGGSWAEIVARRGYDVYLVDVRGYGGSSRPAAMDASPMANPPFATTADAIRDVESAVHFILARRKLSKLDLIGWSWGTAIAGGYTAQHNDQVDKLVLYAPLWYFRGAPTLSATGAYRTVTHDDARARSVRGIPGPRIEEISPTAWFEEWWASTIATDPVGSKQHPPVLRAPNGVLKDFADFWGAGKASWDPGCIRVPTLVIGGEWDQDAPPYMARDVFAGLVHTPCKRLVVIGEGTHVLALEKHRMQLIGEVQRFLDE
ncbi:MAG: alpha/beta hydrolase [Rhodanobacteraceae bacterium]